MSQPQNSDHEPNSAYDAELVELEEQVSKLEKINEAYEVIVRHALGNEKYEAFMKEMQPYLEAQAKAYLKSKPLIRAKIQQILEEDKKLIE